MEEIFENIKNITNDFIKDAKNFIEEQKRKNNKIWYCDKEMEIVYAVNVEEEGNYYKLTPANNDVMFEWTKIPKNICKNCFFETKEEAEQELKRLQDKNTVVE